MAVITTVKKKACQKFKLNFMLPSERLLFFLVLIINENPGTTAKFNKTTANR